MDLLFLCHCVPYPPNKGEKIRAYQEIRTLAKTQGVHLACFARSAEDALNVNALRRYCASTYAEVRTFPHALAWAVLRFAGGHCLNSAFYESRRMKQYVAALCANVNVNGALVYTMPMMQYVPAGLTHVLDLVDVDSEKWFQYARMKRWGWFYRKEAKRLHAEEVRAVQQARLSLLTTENEVAALKSQGETGPIEPLENGVDFDYFDPATTPRLGVLVGRQFVVFIGTMDYFPNIDAACWFANDVFPVLRKENPSIEFLIVGNHPAKEVLHLTQIEGITVTGGVPDVRPYLAHARAVIAPLRLARGIQNKVLEALAMGRYIFASNSVCQTFGPTLPEGVLCCDSVEEYRKAILESVGLFDPSIRARAQARFTWDRNLERLVSAFTSSNRTTEQPCALETNLPKSG
jgi:polysaccharide biosynthesis protein PslH